MRTPREMYDGQGAGLGLWHYCDVSPQAVTPIGYCSPSGPCPTCSSAGLIPAPLAAGGPSCPTCGGSRVVSLSNPCAGHAMPQEAIEHYRLWVAHHATYVLETAIAEPGITSACVTCLRPTVGYAEYAVDGRKRRVALCFDHCDRENLLPKIRLE